MQYKRFNDKLIVRMDRGEEIVAQLKKVCEAEDILLADISALGAVDGFKVGVFDTADKTYKANSFRGSFEIVSLTGTVTQMNGAFYAHLHMSAGDGEGKVFGGHLNEAFVSATCEMVIDIISGEVGRKFDKDVGLNLLDFGE